MIKDLPRIGAALSILDLGRFGDWLREGPRDLELQDFCFASILNGDWQVFVDLELCPKVGDAVIRRHVFPA